ncbi:MAG: hypothetical protein EG825_05615 [Rhodocyclaceae bacterium]|nr:hypothetical protein [Rhodocyclaceae bacterium]
MTISEIFFVSREAAENLLFHPDAAVISVTDPGKRLASLAVWFRQVLRLSFYDAVPGDDFIPVPVPGCFDHRMARQIIDFIDRLHTAPAALKLVVHCEQGISRSAAIALFAAAYSGAPLQNHAGAHGANPWVLEQLCRLAPAVEVDLPVIAETPPMLRTNLTTPC